MGRLYSQGSPGSRARASVSYKHMDFVPLSLWIRFRCFQFSGSSAYHSTKRTMSVLLIKLNE